MRCRSVRSRADCIRLPRIRAKYHGSVLVFAGAAWGGGRARAVFHFLVCTCRRTHRGGIALDPSDTGNDRRPVAVFRQLSNRWRRHHRHREDGLVLRHEGRRLPHDLCELVAQPLLDRVSVPCATAEVRGSRLRSRGALGCRLEPRGRRPPHPLRADRHHDSRCRRPAGGDDNRACRTRTAPGHRHRPWSGAGPALLLRRLGWDLRQHGARCPRIRQAGRRLVHRSVSWRVPVRQSSCCLRGRRGRRSCLPRPMAADRPPCASGSMAAARVDGQCR